MGTNYFKSILLDLVLDATETSVQLFLIEKTKAATNDSFHYRLTF